MRSRLSSIAAAMLALCLVGLQVVALPSASAITFDSGHIDMFNVTADESGELHLDLKEDVTGSHVQRDAESVVIEVGEHAFNEGTAQVPGIDRPTWFLPQTQDPDLPWPGWDTNGVRAGGFEGIDITFVDVSGPGTIFLYTNDTFGSPQSVLSDGSLWLGSGSTIEVPSPAHVHANWGFDAPGTYTLSVVAGGQDGSGNFRESNTATYTFEVAGSEEQVAAAESGGGNSNADDDSDSGSSGSGAGGAAGKASAKSDDADSSESGAVRKGASAPKASDAKSSSAKKSDEKKSASDKKSDEKKSASDKKSDEKKSTAKKAESSKKNASQAADSDDDENDGWNWFTWLSLIGGLLLLAGGIIALVSQLRQEKRDEFADFDSGAPGVGWSNPNGLGYSRPYSEMNSEGRL